MVGVALARRRLGAVDDHQRRRLRRSRGGRDQHRSRATRSQQQVASFPPRSGLRLPLRRVAGVVLDLDLDERQRARLRRQRLAAGPGGAVAAQEAAPLDAADRRR